MASISVMEWQRSVLSSSCRKCGPKRKVTWPTRKETTVTTIMVFVMVVVASIFFLVADQV